MVMSPQRMREIASERFTSWTERFVESGGTPLFALGLQVVDESETPQFILVSLDEDELDKPTLVAMLRKAASELEQLT